MILCIGKLKEGIRGIGAEIVPTGQPQIMKKDPLNQAVANYVMSVKQKLMLVGVGSFFLFLFYRHQKFTLRSL